jgi:branched-subunit amino acid transport protein
MNSQQFLYAVLAMAVVMISFRVIPILFFKNKIKNKFLQSFLAYIPYAVLTSMTFPEVFRSTSSTLSASVGVVAALILAYFGQSLLVVALSSTAVVFVVEQVMKFVK